eukprot:gene3438-6087_t
MSHSPRRQSRSPNRSKSPSPSNEDNNIKKSLTTIFFGNLPYSVDEKELDNLLKDYGEINTITIGYKYGKSLGYAFVDFKKNEDAEVVHKKFENYVLDGRKLKIDWDEGKDKKKRDGPRRRYSRSPPPRRRRYSRSPPPRRRRYSRSPPPRRRRYSRSPPPRRRRYSRSPPPRRRYSRSPRRRRYSKSPSPSPSPPPRRYSKSPVNQ